MGQRQPTNASIPLRPILCALFLAMLGVACSSVKPPPQPPPAAALAARTAAEALKSSENKRWPVAASQWAQAANQFQLLNDLPSLASALHNLAQAQQQLGQPDSARLTLEEAANLNLLLQNTNQWWRNQVALLQLNAQANDTLRLSNQLAFLTTQTTSLLDPAVAGLFHNEVALDHLVHHRLDLAENSLALAQESFRTANDPFGTATIHANLGRLREEQGRPDEAATEWRTALNGFESLAEPEPIADSLAGLGRAMVRVGSNLEEGLRLLRRAADNYRLLGQEQPAAKTLRVLLQTLESTGRGPEAAAVRRELETLTTTPP